MRKYDFNSAQKVDYFIANSENIKGRIQKFYNKEAVVIYPPIEVQKIVKATQNLVKENYFLIVSRLVGAKGLTEAAIAAKNLNFKLKIVGESHGFADVEDKLKKLSGGNLELTGRLSDEDLYLALGKAKGFLAFARDEDFGMTVVESQAAGTPVIAFNGGGFKESVVDGVTGILINDTSEDALINAIKKIKNTKWNRAALIKNAEKFSKERFTREMLQFVSTHANK